jgi:hypothetical protein
MSRHRARHRKSRITLIAATAGIAVVALAATATTVALTGNQHRASAGGASLNAPAPSDSSTSGLSFAESSQQSPSTTPSTRKSTRTTDPTVRPTASATPGAANRVEPSGSASVGSQSLPLASHVQATITQGKAYSATVTVSGGEAPYAWTGVSGLPDGVTATADGSTLTFSGTPEEAGGFPFTVAVHDSSTPHRTASASFTLNVAQPSSQPALSFASPISESTGTVGTAYQAGTSVTGGEGPYTWSVTGLPPGLTETTSDNGSDYEVEGTPTTAGTFSVTATVSDSETPARTLTDQYTLTISPGDWTATGSPYGSTLTVGVPYSTTFTATNGVTVSWAASGIPPGLSMDSATGVLSGTPTRAGAYQLSVTATNVATGETETAGTWNVTVYQAHR